MRFVVMGASCDVVVGFTNKFHRVRPEATNNLLGTVSSGVLVRTERH